MVGGFLVALTASRYMLDYNRLKAVILVYLGFSLALIGVFDEIYGFLHFIVSLMFFIGMIIYLISYSVYNKTIIPFIIAFLHIIMWILHFIYDIPPGAAIPELLAVFSYIPFYTLDYRGLIKY